MRNQALDFSFWNILECPDLTPNMKCLLSKCCVFAKNTSTFFIDAEAIKKSFNNSAKSITRYRDQLIKDGWIEPAHKRMFWTYYKLTQKTKDLIAVKTNAVITGAKESEDKSVQMFGQECLTELIKEPINLKNKQKENEIATETDVQCAEEEVVVSLLIKNGFKARVAKRFVKKHGAEACLKQIKHLEQVQKRGTVIKSTAGWLREAIKNDYYFKAPEVVLSSKERDEKHKKQCDERIEKEKKECEARIKKIPEEELISLRAEADKKAEDHFKHSRWTFGQTIEELTKAIYDQLLGERANAFCS